jgi:hypothetical protein
LYEFNVMPFGLKNASKTFQRLINRILRGAKKYSTAHQDDAAIFSDTWQDHIFHLRDIFTRVRQAGLVIKKSKVQLAKDKYRCLGFVLRGGKIRPDREKLKAVANFQPPKNKKQVRQFLGLTSFYRRNLKNHSMEAYPLIQLTKKNMPGKVKLDDEQLAAFEHLKQALMEAPVVRVPDPTRPYVIKTDASQFGIGAILAQKDDDGTEYVVAYASRKLLDREVKYGVTEKECLCLIWSLKYFENYIYGTKVTVQTDHNCLQFLKTVTGKNPRLTRWSLSLAAFDVDIEYKRGKQHLDADCLSRLFPDKMEN